MVCATYIIGELIAKENLNIENLMQTFKNLLLQNYSTKFLDISYYTQIVLGYACRVVSKIRHWLHSCLLRFSGRLLFSKEDFFQMSVDVTRRKLMDQFRNCLPPYPVLIASC